MTDQYIQVDPCAIAKARDPLGDRVHAAMAVVFVFSIGFGVAIPGILSAVVFVYAILRIWATGPCYRSLVRSPIVWSLFALFVWHALTLAWSLDRTQGLDELKIFRTQIPLLFCFWPVVDRRDRMILALIVGAATVGMAQLGQRLGVGFLVELGWDRATPGRYPGFLHPFATSIVHVTALLLACGGVAYGRRGLRLISGLSIPFVVTGLALAGSRGPWIAALVGLATVMVIVVLRSGERRRWSIPIGIGALVLAAAVSWAIAGDSIRHRLDLAAAEIESAVVEDSYDTDVGRRIRQIELSWELVCERPAIGVGIGSYRPAALALVDEESLDDPDRPLVLPHPHSSVLHIWVTTGSIGLVIYAIFWALLALQAWRDRRTDPFGPVMPALVLAFAGANVLDAHNLTATGTECLMLLTLWTLPGRFRDSVSHPAD
ncbi:MAG: O-antigen ligase family protein [Phycisphaerales bacterium]